MSGPPVEIHLKDGTVPNKAQTAVSIPWHWQTPVKEQYARDIKMDVLERLPTIEDKDCCFGRSTVLNLMEILAEQLNHHSMSLDVSQATHGKELLMLQADIT